MSETIQSILRMRQEPDFGLPMRVPLGTNEVNGVDVFVVRNLQAATKTHGKSVI